ncbi:MAG: hypothetical protein WCR59_06385, partial [Planctomycetota bacterium]
PASGCAVFGLDDRYTDQWMAQNKAHKVLGFGATPALERDGVYGFDREAPHERVFSIDTPPPTVRATTLVRIIARTTALKLVLDTHSVQLWVTARAEIPETNVCITHQLEQHLVRQV